jgi:hypothetical protein
VTVTTYYHPPKSPFKQWLERTFLNHFRDPLDPTGAVIDMTIEQRYNPPGDAQLNSMYQWLDAHDSKYERRLSRLERAQDPPTIQGLLNMALNEVQGAMGPGAASRVLPASRVPLLLDLLIELQGRLLAAEIE